MQIYLINQGDPVDLHEKWSDAARRASAAARRVRSTGLGNSKMGSDPFGDPLWRMVAAAGYVSTQRGVKKAIKTNTAAQNKAYNAKKAAAGSFNSGLDRQMDRMTKRAAAKIGRFGGLATRGALKVQKIAFIRGAKNEKQIATFRDRLNAEGR